MVHPKSSPDDTDHTSTWFVKLLTIILVSLLLLATIATGVL
jgi:hypothetical protein